MTNNKITVLFVFHEPTSSGGATYSGMDMVKSLDRNKILPIVLLPGEGDVKEEMESIGVKCIVAPVDICLGRMMIRILFDVSCMLIADLRHL